MFRRSWRIAPAAALLVVGALVAGCGEEGGSSGSAEAGQTVRFQQPQDPGPSPFTEPADVEGRERVDLRSSGGGSGGGGSSGTPATPFGGTGSNVVCDRDKLIRFLRDHPDRMREWARVEGIKPTYRAVARYIAKLHPVTLTQDTQVTNHTWENGRAVPFQAILQAGTAVLVDKYGRPVARCRCGNPLLQAIYVKEAKCLYCPPKYTPPKPCYYGTDYDYDRTFYRRRYYSNGDYDEIFIRRFRRSPFSRCYTPYPDPPTVTTIAVFRRPREAPQPESPPPSSGAPYRVQPDTGLHCNPPRSQLEYEQCHPPSSEPDTGHTDPSTPPSTDGGGTGTEPSHTPPAEGDADL